MSIGLKRLLAVLGIIFVILFLLAILVFRGIIWPVNPSSMGYSVKGIDVSRYQGEIDWKKISEQDIQFVFMKATEGSSYFDPFYGKNINSALQNNLYCGAYHFFSTESSGKTQAEDFIAIISPFGLDMPPVLDFEVPKGEENKEKIIAEAKIFLDEMEEYYGVKPIIYTTYESYNAYLTEGFEEYPLWIRDLLDEPEIEGEGNIIFWQYCNRGRLDGIDIVEKKQKYTDLNVFYGSEEEFDLFINETRKNMDEKVAKVMESNKS